MAGKSTARCRVREVHNERSLWLHDWIGEKIVLHRAVQHLDSKQSATTLGSVGQFEVGPNPLLGKLLTVIVYDYYNPDGECDSGSK